MSTAALIGLFFLLLAAIFVGLTFRDRIVNGPAATPAGETWSRIAVIFAIVGVLVLLQSWVLR